jgi:parallel beta-helix repeat protein
VQVGSTVANCTAQDNSGDGIVANSSTIRHCTAQANGDDGIEVEFRCYVHDNNSSNNAPAGTGAGIRVTGRWNRIDGNQLTSCNKGLRVSNTDNIVIRNYASDNTTAQYDIDAGNDVGPIGTAASSMSPWANFAP